MKIFSINTGYFKADGGTVFGVVPKTIWAQKVEPDNNNMIPMAAKSLLIDTGEKLILIDTGLGDKQGEKYRKIHNITFPNGKLKDIIKTYGYNAEDITDIIHTHLHHDHCGQTTSIENNNLKLTFPNANIWISKPHWDTVTNPNPRERAAFFPENYMLAADKGKLILVENPTELFPGIFVDFHYGHTNGLMTVKIKYNNKWIIFASDFIPTSHHIYEPYIMSYDMCAAKTLEEKEKFYKWLEGKEACIFLQHDPQWDCATVYKDKKGHKVDSKFQLEQWL